MPEVIRRTGSDGKEVMSNILSDYTGEYLTYKEIDYVPDEADGVVFIFNEGKYYRCTKKVMNAKDFGAKGDGVTNDYVACQAMLNILGYLYFTNGTYLIGSTIINTRWISLTQVYNTSALGIDSGVDIYGESKNFAILKPSAGLIASGEPLIKLDGNADGQGTISNPAAQVGNKLFNFSIDGTSMAIGMYINANWECKISNIKIKNVNNPFKIIGASTPDAGTTSMVEINKVNCINGVTGIDASTSRTGTINVTNSEFRNFTTNAIKGTFASVKFDSVNIVGCGNNSDVLSGGIRILTGTTASQNRAITINNCIFENNKWSEILLENAVGVAITGNTFHPFFNIPTGVGNEQVCIRIIGDATWRVTGVNISGNRIQPAANPNPPATEIFRFLKASGSVRNLIVNALSAPIDSHLQYLYSISDTVEGFKTDSFGVSAGWLIPQGTVIAPFTGTNQVVNQYDSPLLANIVRNYDEAGGIDAGATFVASRFDSQFKYVVPWNGVYMISTGVSFSGLSASHTSIRIILSAGGKTYIMRQNDGAPPSAVNRGNNSVQVRLTTGDVVYLILQVTGAATTVTVSEASAQYTPLQLSIHQL